MMPSDRDFTKEVAEYTVSLGRSLEAAEKQMNRALVVEHEGRKYIDNGKGDLIAFRPPSPKPMNVGTLTGLIDYIKQDVDGRVSGGEGLIVHVRDANTIEIVSRPEPKFQDRTEYLKCTNVNAQSTFEFNRFHDLENFIISLLSKFVYTDEIKEILPLLTGIKDENVATWGDDGISQSVTAKTGIATVKQVRVPNPVKLRPYRTFLEVDQPYSLFVLRLRKGEFSPQCALFDADGGAWKLKAIEKILDFLVENLPDDIPVIA